MFLIFDTETTGLPKNYSAPVSDTENWPRMVQVAWQLHNKNGRLIKSGNHIVKPDGFTIPYNSEKIHGISTQRALDEGIELSETLKDFMESANEAEFLVGHNINFDINIVGCELFRMGVENKLAEVKVLDTMQFAIDYCQIPGGRGGGFKFPTLSELHQKLFGEPFEDAHNAAADVEATTRCFLEMLNLKVIPQQEAALTDENWFFIKNNRNDWMNLEVYQGDEAFEETKKEEEVQSVKDIIKEAGKVDIDTPFTHLHCHSQFSVLQSTASISKLVNKAKEYGMPAVALTDHGNMFGAFSFVKEAAKAGIKPIVGCEFYVTEDRTKQKFTKDNPDRRNNQVLFAKNKDGYKNLIKLCSIGHLEGNYAGYPRIDKEVLVQYKENLIATTGGIYGEIPNLILNFGETQAEDAFKWWHEQFGEDFYIQLMRHGLPEEERVNEVLLAFAEKYGVKYIAANNSYYIDKSDADAHDILLCVKDGELQQTPIGRGRGFRFGFPNQEFYFKSQDEMKKLFHDLPEAIETTNEIVEKVEAYELKQPPIMPNFPLPEGFEDADDYLRHITYEGAAKRYPEMNDATRERIDFELATIKKMGYPGYFLIVADFLNQARDMGVRVGPGRGSAAGSVVAYCLKITDVDPIAFDLLFERFLNPDRISLPDIDIDFDEDGREKVMQWVVDKYGADKVAQIITFGSMAPKMAIRDVARVKDLDLGEANRLAKMIPERPGTSFKKAYKEVPELEEEKKSPNKLVKETLETAEILEGSIRNTGTHACGVIIGRDPLTEHIPISSARDSAIPVTQFDGGEVEDAGMLKMDFLGLKTLAIINDTLENIQKSKGIDFDIDNIPYDDKKTYELYANAETNGIFQFESDGMKKHLKALKPNRFEDLIAMNALYRPGPMEYIPSFIARKHGQEEVVYDLDDCEEYLKETYGITVYQEQVMLLSQKLASFTKGQADSLRKAMGKKIFAMLEELKPLFLEGGQKNGHKKETLEKIWKDWEAFASYAFNKSHSTCYAYVSYRMAYLKAHYPPEFMAAVLSRNLNDIKKVGFFMEECRRMGTRVLGPDVNESQYKFAVNQDGQIRFGLGAVKGVGEGAVQAILEEREANGPYTSIFDMARRINLKAANKKCFESLALAGAFDSFAGIHRAQYFYDSNKDGQTLIEKALKFGNKVQENAASSQHSLFGEESEVEMPEPEIADCEPWSEMVQLNKEKEVTGMYISGHPLNDYKLEIQYFCSHRVMHLNQIEEFKGRTLTVAGMVTGVQHRTTKSGKPFGLVMLEGFNDASQIALFGEDYLKNRHLLVDGFFLYVTGRVQNRFNGEELEFKISSIQLLSEIRDKMAKSITLSLPIGVVSEEFVQGFTSHVNQNPGNCSLSLNIFDPEDVTLKVRMPSKKYKVQLNNEFLDFLETIPELNYKLN